MGETGQSPPLIQFSPGSHCPQERKRERKVRANYVGVYNMFFLNEKGLFSGKRGKQYNPV